MTNRIDRADAWCILRTSGGRTLPLARSLQAAGFEVWTPSMVVMRRLPRRRQRIERDAPILPTFVFARAERLQDLLQAMSDPRTDHPPFSLFRHAGRFPLVTSDQIASLHDEEDRAADVHRRTRERERAAERRATCAVPVVGSEVRLPFHAFTGLVGTVESVKGKSAVVNFGGGRTITIGAWLLETGEVQTTNYPETGTRS